MDEPKPAPTATTSSPTTEPAVPSAAGSAESIAARGSGVIAAVPERIERTEHSVMEGLPKDKAERVAAMRRELAELQKQLTEAQQRIATELQGRADDAERLEDLEAEVAELRAKAAAAEDVQSTHAKLESELEEERTKHRDAREQLAMQETALSDANALVVTRNTELAEITSKRDAVQAELDAAKREIEVARARLWDVAKQIVQLGNGLLEPAPVTAEPPKPVVDDVRVEPKSVVEDVRVEPKSEEAAPAEASPAESGSKPAIPLPAVKRAEPPPIPARVDSDLDAAPIFEVTEEAKPASPLRTAMVLIGGVAAGCAVTFALMRGHGATARAAVDTQDMAAPIEAPAAANTPPAMQGEPAAMQPSPAQPDVTTPPTEATATNTAPAATNTAPTATNTATAATNTASAAAASTEGVIVLPESADGHRVYVDRKVVQVKDSRATVSCGTHEVRIGSSGTAQTIDIACGGETTLAER